MGEVVEVFADQIDSFACLDESWADLGQSFLCEKGTDRGFPDSFVKIMYQRFLITLPSAYIHDELNDHNAR